MDCECERKIDDCFSCDNSEYVICDDDFCFEEKNCCGCKKKITKKDYKCEKCEIDICMNCFVNLYKNRCPKCIFSNESKCDIEFCKDKCNQKNKYFDDKWCDNRCFENKYYEDKCFENKYCEDKCCKDKCSKNICSNIFISDSEILEYLLWKYRLDKCKVIYSMKKSKEKEIKLITIKKFFQSNQNLYFKSVKEQYKLFEKWNYECNNGCVCITFCEFEDYYINHCNFNN